MPDIAVERRKLPFYIRNSPNIEYICRRLRVKPDAEGYIHVEVAYCPACHEHGMPDHPDDFVHSALCVVRLTDQNQDRTHLCESDRVKVLTTLFSTAGQLLGTSNAAAQQALKKLYAWVPDVPLPAGVIARARKDGMLDPKETLDDVPFLSETYLYVLLGKEEGRTLLALVRAVAKAVGYEEGQ